MTNDELPTFNDFLSQLYTIRDDSAARAKAQANAITAQNAARGLLRSGATLKALASLIETEFDNSLTAILTLLRHIKSVRTIDYQACRNQALLQARELTTVLRGATDLEKWFKMIGRGSATDIIDKRLDILHQKTEYRFRQFDVGLDQVGATKNDTITPTTTRLQRRLDDRRAWFQNEWFFKWHHIGGDKIVEIDQFNGKKACYSGIAFFGTPRNIYWELIAQGVRKEIIDQLGWVEESVKGYDRSVAIRAIDQCAGLLASFARSIRREAVAKDRILRGDGRTFPASEDLGRWHGTTDGEVFAQAKALKAALFPTTVSDLHITQLSASGENMDRETRSFQVALSFAGEQRAYVRNVATALAARHISVFYDEFESNALWGKDGAEHFHQIYSRASQYVVMFISADYVQKAWTRQERRSAISRQMKDDAEYILPVRFDHTEVPGLPDTLQYLLADRFTPAELALEIAKKIGVRPTIGKASDVPPPASGSMSGEVTFDYSAYNGRYIIGSGATTFETAWSKASDKSIHLMNDPPSIHGVAIARGAKSFDEISDASDYDFTSRVRTVKTGEIAVLRNSNDFYAAVQIIHIEDDSRGASSDALTLRYTILPTGEKNFTLQMSEATMA
ncbi:toll/interleukin-1 receptor domain-containing protein [Sphingomonas sp. LT1P40]|uniref:toll/interleukin-1 receptor domain-containing protein n=1 Tax=Alteristakelama amylovorans TaxID=3096166 RepID=UPI002FC79B47